MSASRPSATLAHEQPARWDVARSDRWGRILWVAFILIVVLKQFVNPSRPDILTTYHSASCRWVVWGFPALVHPVTA